MDETWTQYAWPVIAAISALIALGASIVFIRKVLSYMRGSSYAAASVHSAEVIPQGSGYRIKIAYSYSVGSKKYQGNDTLHTHFTCEEAAKGGAQAVQELTPTIYFEPGKPQHSGLKKRIPWIGLIVSAVVTLAFAALCIVSLIYWNPSTLEHKADKSQSHIAT